MTKRVFSVVLAFALLLSAAGCGRKAGPADTITSFQDAFNQYDLDKMLDCVKPSVAETVRSLLSSEGKNYSFKHTLVTALLKMGFPVLPLLTGGIISNDDLPKLELVCGEAVETGDTASVPVDGTLTVGDGTLSFQVTVNLERGKNETWYIVGLDTEEEAAAEQTVL